MRRHVNSCSSKQCDVSPRRAGEHSAPAPTLEILESRLLLAVGVAIGDFVWNDLNANGIQETGEPGIEGATLTLTGTNEDGVEVTHHATTDANGKYQFTEAPGTYQVQVDASNFGGEGALVGFNASPTGRGEDTALDSNANGSGTTLPTLQGGWSDLTIDFGFYQPVTIGNFVWNDLNDNGIQNTGEAGIQGVTLTLTGTNGAGVSVTDHATTDANGKYLFTEAAGTYTVTVDATNSIGGGALAGYIASPTSQGVDRTVDSNPNPSGTTPSALPGGSNDLTLDFGYFGPSPAINILKLTNGTNTDVAPVPGTPDGPIVPVGGAVTWTYEVTNPGNEPIANVSVTDSVSGVNPAPVLAGSFNVGDTNDDNLLETGETWVFTASGIAIAGQYSNIGTATGTSTISNTVVTANNPDHYFGANPLINIVKLTNGTDNDSPTGPVVAVGSTVTWTYNVTDPGNEPIANVSVTDSVSGVSPTPVLSGGFNTGDTNLDNLLEAGETWVFSASGVAAAGQYSNIGTVTGTSTISNTPVTANNPDHYFGQSNPGIDLVKTAAPISVVPGQPVTYTYTVTNTGGVTLTNVVVTDDAGTPNFAGDDFTVGTIANLAAGASQTLTVIAYPPITECALIGSNPDTPVGTLIIQVLPGDDIKVIYIQEQNVNDNRYGTGATAAAGWLRSHNFSDLVGSDEAHFAFTNGNGATVLDFQVDYISAATKAIFPSGTVLYPSGYGTLGVSGGDGKMLVGSAANVLSATTSLTENLKKPQFVSGFLANSPPETAPNSSISTPLGWDYYDSYTVIVSHAAFGAAGFGGVTIVGVHDSPPKAGSNLVTPEPCDSTVTNTATVTAIAGGTTLTASDDATVAIVVGGANSGAVTAGVPVVKGKTVSLTLTNTGGTSVTLTSISVVWASKNGKLMDVKIGATKIYDHDTAAPSASISSFLGKASLRTLAPGKSITLVFDFQNNADTILSDYDFTFGFSDGLTLVV